MNILLVCGHIRKKLNFSILTYQSHTLQKIAGLTPNNHQVKIVDLRYEDIDFNEQYDLVGISCTTTQAFYCYDTADKFRSKGVCVVIGGYHATALPEEAKQHADSVVIGEAEETWPRLLKDFENGRLKPFYKNSEPIKPEKIRPADREAGGNFPSVAGIEASRGCPVGCEFCAVSNIVGGKKFRPRKVEDVIDEIKSIKTKWLYFFSPSMTINPKYSKSIFKEMKDLDKKFTCFGNIDVLGKDEELLALSSEAGCQSWFVGFESVNQENINYLGKNNKVEDYKKSVKKIHRYGMHVIGAFVFGLDKDTQDVFDKTVKMVSSLDIDTPDFTILTPYPGTPLFDRLEREGRILTRDWSRYNEISDVVFQPKNMSPEELLEGTKYAYKKVNSFLNIVKRMYLTKNFNLWYHIRRPL